MRFGPIELYKKLPKTNCGDCGQPSCLAFATQVVGLEAQAKILFDATALDYLDLEGLTFVAEKLADKLTSI